MQRIREVYDNMSSVSETASEVQSCAHCGFSWATLSRVELATAHERCPSESFVNVMKAAEQ